MSRNALGIGFVVVALALPVLSFGAAPAAAPAAGGLTLPDYTVSPGDTLDISVWKEPDLTKTVPIRPDGKFSFPLAGELVAQGHTVGQIQSELISRMQKYIPEPVVTVALSGMDGSRIYVIGQVAKAGSFAMNPRLTVLQALAVAGGMTPFASTNDIIVLRGKGGSQHSIPFHYGEVAKGRNLSQDIPLESGDVVIVP